MHVIFQMFLLCNMTNVPGYLQDNAYLYSNKNVIVTCARIVVLQWLSVPFAWYNKKVDFNKPGLDLVGEIKSKDFLSYIDYALLLVFGGIPWQVYFQRVLSSKSASQAQILSYVAAFGCFIMAIPPVIIGMVARATGV